MTDCKGVVSSIYNGSAVDGPGIRCVVFMSGCNMRCPFCHNPETFDTTKGKEYTSQQLFYHILKYKNYIKNGGVTFSGGEPFLQAEFCTEVAKLCRQENINVAVETNGTIIDRQFISACDYIITDVKNYDGKLDSNIYDFLKACNQLKKPVLLTNVLITGVNDELKSLKQLKDISKSYDNIIRTDFLSFKKHCTEKYKNLDLPFAYEKMAETKDSYAKEITEYFIKI